MVHTIGSFGSINDQKHNIHVCVFNALSQASNTGDVCIKSAGNHLSSLNCFDGRNITDSSFAIHGFCVSFMLRAVGLHGFLVGYSALNNSAVMATLVTLMMRTIDVGGVVISREYSMNLHCDGRSPRPKGNNSHFSDPCLLPRRVTRPLVVDVTHPTTVIFMLCTFIPTRQGRGPGRATPPALIF